MLEKFLDPLSNKQKRYFKTVLGDKGNKELEDKVNLKRMFINPETGTVQPLNLWHSQTNETFDETKLLEVKLSNDKWVVVS
jgi:hypothetical protein